jgi:hypothetical protein
MPGEPDRCYGRFQFYLSLGPLRTIKETARRAGLEQRNKPYHSGGRWADVARVWCWRERAQAWDAEQRALLGLSERNMRLALRHRRVGVMEDTLERVRAALDEARIDEADQEQARKWLTDLRHFLCDLLVIQRQEFERIDYSQDEQDPYNRAPITADDLRAAQRAMEEEAARRQGDTQGYVEEAARRRGRPLRPAADLLVIQQGDDDPSARLQLWREVRAASGLQFGRVVNPTQKNFAGLVHLGRGLKKPARFLYVAIAADGEGVHFSDGMMGGEWLRKRLKGIEVLVLAHYRGEGDPGWAQGVPCVITVEAGMDEVERTEFTRGFWEAIGGGADPEAALETALGLCTADVQACVRRRW